MQNEPHPPNVVRLDDFRQKPKDTSCPFAKDCALHQATKDIDDPIAAVFAMVTRSGQIIRGAQNVKRTHVRALTRALDLLQVELHQALQKQKAK